MITYIQPQVKPSTGKSKGKKKKLKSGKGKVGIKNPTEESENIAGGPLASEVRLFFHIVKCIVSWYSRGLLHMKVERVCDV